MFLFTNASVGTRETGAPAVSGRTVTGRGDERVIAAIREGAERSGVGFDYMLATAQRESALDPSAKAATSSATGLYQFIEQTWLGVMKTSGQKLGLSSYSDHISARADGTYTVSDPQARQAILDLRRDPRVASAMAGELTQRNRETLGAALGREPTSGDLYAAHVLGAKGAATLIATAQASPARAAALDMPEAAAANRSLFYDKAGQARGAAELYARLATSTAEGRPAVAGASSLQDANAQGSSLPEMTTAYASLDSSLRSLFQTDRRQGAVSENVARLWQGRAAATGSTSSTGTGRIAPTYFPRSDPAEDVTAEAMPGTAARNGATQDGTAQNGAGQDGAGQAIVVPLPPRRPATLAATGTRPANARPGSLFDQSAYTLRNGS